MTKILYIWQAGYPWDVRAEKICRELKDRGCEVTLLARWRPGQPPEELVDGLRVVRAGHGLPGAASLPVPGNPVWGRAIRRLVRGWKPDLVIAREIMLAAPAQSACRGAGTPVIIDMAEHYPAAMRTWDKYRRGAIARLLVFRARLPDRIERAAVARADGIVTVCAEQNARLAREFGYPEDGMAVVHNTLDREFFAPVRLGCNQPARVFAHHGYMTSMRGIDRIIRGFAIAARSEPEIELVLAGSGEAAAFRQLARDEGVADRVRLTGPYRHDDLVRLYSEADVGVVAYPSSEALEHTIPNKLFDYMAAGKPVVVTPIGPFRRIVEEAGCGIVLDGEAPDAIARGILALRRGDLAAMTAGGLAAARGRYHWGRDAATLVEFLGRYVPIPAPGPARPSEGDPPC